MSRLVVHDLRREPGLRQAALTLNAGVEAETSPLDMPALEALLAEAMQAPALVEDGQMLGFLLLFGPGAAYESPNYRWFANTLARFSYIDRVVVAPEARGRGIGRRLYDIVSGLAETGPGDVRLSKAGRVEDALTPDRQTPDGLARDGLARDGLAPDGLAPDGLAPDGLAPDGLSPGAPTPDGALTAEVSFSKGTGTNGPGTLVCEVNLVPPNPVSDAFHARLGFVEVGRASPSPGKTVRYLARPAPALHAG